PGATRPGTWSLRAWVPPSFVGLAAFRGSPLPLTAWAVPRKPVTLRSVRREKTQGQPNSAAPASTLLRCGGGTLAAGSAFRGLFAVAAGRSGGGGLVALRGKVLEGRLGGLPADRGELGLAPLLDDGLPLLRGDVLVAHRGALQENVVGHLVGKVLQEGRPL